MLVAHQNSLESVSLGFGKENHFLFPLGFFVPSFVILPRGGHVYVLRPSTSLFHLKKDRLECMKWTENSIRGHEANLRHHVALLV